MSAGRIHVNREAPVDAGRFSDWLHTFQRVLRSGETSEVPCGSCTACCTASQFVHIAPDGGTQLP